jgi:hypothetical protein
VAEGEHKRPQRYYVTGDEILIRVELTHRQNLEEVRVTFGKDGGRDNTITLIGELDSTEDAGPVGAQKVGPYHVTRGSSYRRKQSTATLRTLVDVDHTPGHYELLGITCRTTRGLTVHESADDPDTGLSGDSFRILHEPEPRLEARVELIDEDDLD